MIQTLWYILAKKRHFHRLESDSARNNIHPNNKQKPKITNKKHRKNYINLASQFECERCFETYVVIFTYIFRSYG